jgi:hypothetical protein
MSAKLSEKHPGAVFPEDSETIRWTFSRREEHNLPYQSRLNLDTRHCDDVLPGASVVELPQAKHQ